MIMSGLSGCELMMILQTHLVKNELTMAHRGQMFCIKIKDGMMILFTDHTYHAGASHDSSVDKICVF